MALVPISQSQVAIPDSRSVEVAAPVSSGVLGGVADALNHSVGWRQLRSGNWVIERKHNYTLGGVLTEDPSGKGFQRFPLLFPTSFRAEYLQVLVTYQARKNPLVANRSINVWLLTSTGTIVDGNAASPAFKWDIADGTLGQGEGTSGYTSGTTFTVYPVRHANTGITIDDTPTTPTTPRCLNLTTFAGQTLVLWIEEIDCRILTVSVKELYKELVDQ